MKIFLSLSIFFCIILASLPTINIVQASSKSEKIETTYITTNTLTTKNKKAMFNNSEIESIIADGVEKSFNEETSYNINHLDKNINIELIVNEEDGDVKSIINNSIYNFLNITKEFVFYDIDFNITVRYKDSNGRYLKKEMYSYGFHSETLSNIDWKKIKVKDFVNNANKHWTIDDGVKENKIIDDELKIKILEIIKFYLKQKISNKSQ